MKAPLEGDRISPAEKLPDFPSPKAMFILPRWRVNVYCGGLLVKVHEWVAAPTAEAAINHVGAYGYEDVVRYEATEVKE